MAAAPLRPATSGSPQGVSPLRPHSPSEPFSTPSSSSDVRPAPENVGYPAPTRPSPQPTDMFAGAEEDLRWDSCYLADATETDVSPRVAMWYIR